jgi:predicted permease
VPDRLVAIWADVSERGGPVDEWLNYEDFASLMEEPGLLEAAATWGDWQPTLVGSGDPEVIPGATISYAMLGEVLRAGAAEGRVFQSSDDVPGADGVVLLSHAAWERRFASDPRVVGRTLTLSDIPYTVVGVMPRGFRLPTAPGAEIYRAMGVLGELGCGRGCFGTRVVARLEPGVSRALATERARDLGARLAQAFPDTNTGLSFTVVGLREQITGESATGLWVLLGAVGFVLLIACTNVASLLLVRGAAREGDMGVRVALGAGRASILRHLLAEGLLLAVLGGVAGLALASWGTEALVSGAPTGALPRTDEIALDGRVLAFAAAVTLLTGLVFGLVPAWRASRPGLYTAIRSHGGWPGRLRNGLVVAEVGIALVLLVGAGLLLKSAARLGSADLGFEDAARVLTFRVSLPGTRYDPDERLAFFTTLVERVGSLPGVSSVGAVNSLPLSGSNSDVDFYVEGATLPERGSSQASWLRPVIGDYFATIGLEVVEGRAISASDDERSPPAVVVNESLAQRYLDGEALGQRIAFGDPDGTLWTVVGVVRDVRHFALREGVAAGADPTASTDAPASYLSYAQALRLFGPGQMSMAARVQGDPAALISDVRRTVADLDPALAAARIQPLQTFVDDAMARDRFVTRLLAAFAATALLLAALGIYGVVSYGVSRRMREMGIRRALGAEWSDVSFMVVKGGMRLAAMGIALGVASSLALSRVLQSLLYDVEATDPATFVGMAALLAAVALLASWLPARRVKRADPVAVLRSE